MRRATPSWCHVGTLVFFALLIVFYFSLGFRFGHSGRVSVGVSHGALWLGEINTPDRGGGWFLVENQATYIIWWRRATWGQSTYGHLIIPLWIPMILVGMPCAVAWWRALRRFAPGHCAKCGYNLTGLPEPRCPECGTGFES